MFDFEYQLKILPDKPGVYLMKNSLGEIIYVGKAKILKNRVKQYFKSSKNNSVKVKAMVRNIAEFEYIVTDSEMEALILECNLIKKHKPRYNILLKDDKHYPFIKVTVSEDFPRVFITRILDKDGSKYFGPYTNVSAVYETIELIKKIFPIRTCKLKIKEGGEKTRPCLNHYIHLCDAPCAGLISKVSYGEIVKGITDILSGKDATIIKQLRTSMEEKAKILEFESAASYRDKIIAVGKITEKQKIMTGNFENEDFINLDSDEKDTCINIFFLRDGNITGREHYIVEDTAGEENSAIITEFIKEFYEGVAFVPKTIYVPEILDSELLADWLSMKKNAKVEIHIPQKGSKKELLDMVWKNANVVLDQFKFNS